MANAARAYAATVVTWLAHIDADEFILADIPVADALAALPRDIAQTRMMPAELLAPVAPGTTSHFKLPPQAAGQPRAVLEELYPDYGLHLRNGLISHGEGKAFFRTGLADARPGIHALLLPGQRRAPEQRLDRIRLGHAHAPSWDAFHRNLPTRRANGSYSAARDGQLSLSELFDAIVQTTGDSGFRDFFDTVCTATPAHLAALASRGMLLSRDLRLDAKARKLFPQLVDEDWH